MDAALLPTLRPILSAGQYGGPAKPLPTITPEQLFLEGDNGGIWRMNAAGSLWQDAGSTPAADGDSVAQIDDQSGLGNNLSASSETLGVLSSRQALPILQLGFAEGLADSYAWAFGGVTGTCGFVTAQGKAQVFTLDAIATAPYMQFIELFFIDRILTSTERQQLLTYFNGLTVGIEKWDFEVLGDTYTHVGTGSDPAPGASLQLEFSDTQTQDMASDFSQLAFADARVQGRVVASSKPVVVVLFLDVSGSFLETGISETTGPQFDASGYASLSFFYQGSNLQGGFDWRKMPAVGGGFSPQFPALTGRLRGAPSPSLSSFALDNVSCTGTLDLHGTQFTGGQFDQTQFSSIDCSGLTDLGSVATPTTLLNGDFSSSSMHLNYAKAIMQAAIDAGLSNGALDFSDCGNIVFDDDAVALQTTLEGNGWAITASIAPELPSFQEGDIDYLHGSGGFRGTIPDPAVALATLFNVDVSRNPLLHGALPDLSAMTYGLNWDSQLCSLSGEIPIYPNESSVYVGSNAGLTSVAGYQYGGTLDASDCGVAGDLPAGDIDMLYFRMPNNQITGWGGGILAAATVDLSGNALTEAAVDALLAAFAYGRDGSGPVVSPGSILLAGGTSAPPSAAGLASKTVIEGFGCTVEVNT